MRKSAVIAIAVVIVAVAAGVAIYEYYGTMGTLRVAVADAPVGNVSAVYITFSSIALHGNSSGWTNYSLSSRTVDIYDLTVSNATILGNLTVHSGKYTMIRVYITNVVVTIGGVNETFRLASKAGFLNHPFTIAPHTTVGFTLEFDLHQCLNLNAMIFTPYLGVVVS
ncbi:MAG: DUF4382 domain-containing protein [Thermoplasmata archaeon]